MLLAIGPVVEQEGRLRQTAQFDPALWGTGEVWFEVDADGPLVPSAWGDPFLISVAQPALEQGLPVHVTGAPVSPSLLRNLEEFREAWRCWRGGTAQPITADAVEERPVAGEEEVVAFSGGVDSAFTLHRRTSDAPGHHRRRAQAALFVEGFDIAVGNPDYGRARARLAPPVEARGVPVVGLTTNIRDLHEDWRQYHGSALAAALHFVGSSAGGGVIAASDTYDNVYLPWGSNPVTDHLLGTEHFPIDHDGAAVKRIDKVQALSDWPEMLERLRFCWSGPRADRNCGTCRKCVTMAAILRLLDLPEGCFETPVSDRHIARVLRRSGYSGFTVAANEAVLAEAAARGVDRPWVRPLRRRVRRARYGPLLRTLWTPAARRLGVGRRSAAP